MNICGGACRYLWSRQDGGLWRGDWTIRISKTGGGRNPDSAKSPSSAGTAGNPRGSPEPGLGFLGRVRRHENLHDIIGAGRITSGFRAQLQLHDGSRAREFAQFQSALARPGVVFQSLQRKRELDARRGGGGIPLEFENAEPSEFVESDPFAEFKIEKLGSVATRSPGVVQFDELRLGRMALQRAQPVPP